MKAYFSFPHQFVCDTTNDLYDAICLFYGAKRDIPSTGIFSDVEAEIKSASGILDCLLVIAPETEISAIVQVWLDRDSQRETIRQRGMSGSVQSIKGVYFYGWSRNGFVLHKIDSFHKDEFQIDVSRIVSSGLGELLKRNKVCQVAPAGHTFRHPSGKVNRLFIQARELATDEPQLQFVANSMAIELGERLQHAQIVYIDTMGIYGIVKAAITIAGSQARVESYHSYDDLPSLSPVGEPHLCIISASTSGGMAKDLVLMNRFSSNAILTMIDVTARSRHGEVLIALDQLGHRFEDLLTDRAGTEIELSGEHFSTKAKPPRQVTIGLPHHPKVLDQHLTGVLLEGIKPINSRGRTRPGEDWIFNLDAHTIYSAAAFKAWLKQQVEWAVPISVDHIVYADGEAAKAIANAVVEIIADLAGRTEPVKVVPRSDISSELTNAKGVLVVAALVGDGTELREISRDLREVVPYQTPRHFLVGLATPHSQISWERLAQFLERNRSERKYGVSKWKVLPLGQEGASSAWKLYGELSEKAQLLMGEWSPAQQKSLDLVAEVISSAYNGFLPDHNGSMLRLTDGFVFMHDAHATALDALPVQSAIVNVIISAVLQCAREHRDEIACLASTGYESTVISPETFLRFNDGILQAAILRSATPAELDYSSSPEISRLMSEFLIKVFLRRAKPYGAAALEFAAAMTVGRLRLKADDMNAVIDTVLGEVSSEESALHGLMLLANEKYLRISHDS